MEVQGEIHIKAARSAVWRRFMEVEKWPQWHPQVAKATWGAGSPWTENAELRLTVSPLGFPVPIVAFLRMVAPPHMVIWESRFLGLNAVHVYEFSESLGGCLVSDRETYHGPVALMMGLLAPVQQRAFQTALANLKDLVEGQRPRDF